MQRIVPDCEKCCNRKRSLWYALLFINFGVCMRNQKYFYSFVICLCAISLCCLGCSKDKTKSAVRSIEEVDFDISMGKGTNDYRHIFVNASDVERYQIFKKLY